MWQYHATLMIFGFSLTVAGAGVSRYMKNRPWWLRVHRRLEISGALFSLLGLIMAIYYVQSTSGVHFRAPHALLGAVTIALVVITAVSGYAQLKSKTYGPKIRKIHPWLGRLTILLMLITIVGGLSLAGVI
ncbi:MAG: hypothetical protein AB1305_02325 [Candidatus Hadarchaeota archaeon]